MVVHVSPDGSQWGNFAGDARSAKLADGARRRAHEGGHCVGILMLEFLFRLRVLEQLFLEIDFQFVVGRSAGKSRCMKRRRMNDERQTYWTEERPYTRTWHQEESHSPKLYLSFWLAYLLSRRNPSRSRQAQAPHGFAQRVNPTLRPWVCDV